MEQALLDGKTDLISMARSFIADPEYGKKLYEGRPEDIVPCLRCNKCHRTSPLDPWIDACSVNPLWSYEHKAERLFDPPSSKKKVAVIGGGPAGMNAAIRLRSRGHEVDLYEKTNSLGGLLNTSEDVSFKWPLRDYRDWLIRQTAKSGATVILNSKPEPQELSGYDYIIAAVGSKPQTPPIPGADQPFVLDAVSAYSQLDKIGQTAVIIGGGEIGVELGMHLAQNGRNATVLEMTGTLAADCTPTHYRSLFIRAWTALSDKLTLLANAKATKINEGSVEYTDLYGIPRAIKADAIILATGLTPKTDEALEYANAGAPFYMLGDCRQVANVLRLNQSALGIANLI
jgi:NADPH-dependent 2,4-dienoyl-CoA reductase/sulfur reductase-like enzyme